MSGTVAVVGLGEAGRAYAEALLELGETVVGTDPVATEVDPRIKQVPTVAEAVDGADLVLVLTGASAAPAVAEAAIPKLGAGVVYADMTSSSPRAMRDIGAQVQATGASFVDVAILGPVPWYGAKTPVAVAGEGREQVAELLARAGAPVEVLDDQPGSAMAHKLLRSIFMKGLAALIWEAVEAGRAAGYEDWIREQVARQLAGDGQAVIDRLLGGTKTHAVRRGREMEDVVGYLEDLGVEPAMSRATVEVHRRVANA